MKPICFYAFTKNIYNDREACAYIYYGTTKHPENHLNQSISVLHNSKDQLAFEKHLREEMLPLANAYLKGSGFKAIDIGYTNQEPKPYLVIRHRSNKLLSDTDLKWIRSNLEFMVNTVNRQSSLPVKKRDNRTPTFFIPEERKQPTHKKARHGYNLRPRLR